MAYVWLYFTVNININIQTQLCQLALLQLMAWCLFYAKALSEPILIWYYKLDPLGQTLVKF